MPATLDELIERFQALPEVQRQALLRQHVGLVAECSWEAGEALQLELKERRQRAADCARRRSCFVLLRRAEADAKRAIKQAEVDARKAVKAHRAALNQLKREIKAAGKDRLRALRKQAATIRRIQMGKPPMKSQQKQPKVLTLSERMSAAWDQLPREFKS